MSLRMEASSVMRIKRSALAVSFFFNDTATTEIYTLSLHDALPISIAFRLAHERRRRLHAQEGDLRLRSEEHTSELQSPCNLVCRLLLEKKKEDQHPAEVVGRVR